LYSTIFPLGIPLVWKNTGSRDNNLHAFETPKA
jgi:hypothetical protein